MRCGALSFTTLSYGNGVRRRRREAVMHHLRQSPRCARVADKLTLRTQKSKRPPSVEALEGSFSYCLNYSALVFRAAAAMSCIGGPPPARRRLPDHAPMAAASTMNYQPPAYLQEKSGAQTTTTCAVLISIAPLPATSLSRSLTTEALTIKRPPRLAASFISNQACNFGSWPISSVPVVHFRVRFVGLLP
jgi:hypothetical protein